MITKFTPMKFLPLVLPTHLSFLVYIEHFLHHLQIWVFHIPISQLGNTHLRRMHSSPRRLTSLVEFMKSRCLVKKKKRQHPTNIQEVKQEPLLKNTGNLLTLQEWILASPNRNSCNSRVYPTFEKIEEGLSNKPGDSFSIEKLLIMEVDGEMEDSSSRSSLNGKTIKNVRFRLPAVADIFILDSPGGYSAM